MMLGNNAALHLSLSLFFLHWTSDGYIWDIMISIQDSVGPDVCRSSNHGIVCNCNEHEEN